MGFFGGTYQATGASLCDGDWHLVDVSVNTSDSTYTADWWVDEAAQTQAVRTGQSAASVTAWRVGTPNTSDGTPTVWFQDFVLSATAGDAPIGPHIVLPLYPTGEGTDNLGGVIKDEGGATSNLFQKVDDWNGGTPDTATYVTQDATDTTAYAEFTVGDPDGSNVWDVIGMIGGFSNSTAQPSSLTVKTQVVDSGGTAIDTIDNAIDYSGSTTVLGYYRKVLARPGGGWDTSTLSGVKIRWGYTTVSSARQARLSGVMLEYARSWSSGTTVSVDTPGALALAGAAVTFTTTLATSTGALTLMGSTVTAESGVTVSVDVPGAIGLAGQTVDVISTMAVGAGALTLTGGTIDLGVPTTVTVDTPGVLALVGESLTLGVGLDVAGGLITLAGQAITTSAALEILPGEMTITGGAATLATVMAVDAGAIGFAGGSVSAAPPSFAREHGAGAVTPEESAAGIGTDATAGGVTPDITSGASGGE
jgi:hypothetical protein